MRLVAAHHTCAAVEYRGLTLQQAVRETLTRLRELGGSGGLIGVDDAGRLVMDFNTPGMLRAARDSAGQRQIEL